MRVTSKKCILMLSICILFVISAFLAIGTFVDASAEEAVLQPKYKFDFSDESDRGKNTGTETSVTATVNGGTYAENSIQGKTALTLNSTTAEIPGAALNRDSVTIAGWFKIPSNTEAYKKMLTIYAQKEDKAYSVNITPVTQIWQRYGMQINAIVGGTYLAGESFWGDSNGQGDGATWTPFKNSLAVFDAWVHYAYELTPQGFHYYQNGVKIFTKEGDFTASRWYAENAKIILGSDGYNGSYADIRVYDGALTGEQIIAEYGITYSDLLTTEYTFENGVTERVRGYNGAFKGNAKVQNDGEKGNVLYLDGTQTDATNDSKTAFIIPNTTLHGHNRLTISLDAYVDSANSNYARLFEFTSDGQHWDNPPTYQGGQRVLLLGAKWDSHTKLVFDATCGAGTDKTVVTETGFNRWANITITMEETRAVVYIDGMPVACNETDFQYFNSMFYLTTGTFAFGRTSYWDNAPLIGKIDNIKIWQTALTEKEVMTELGIITEQNDTTAVSAAKNNLEITYDGTTAKIDLPAYTEQGVKVTWSSSAPSVIDTEGNVFIPVTETSVTLTATLSRGTVTDTKVFNVMVRAQAMKNPSVRFGTDLSSVSFAEDSYYYKLMEKNLDYMMGLNKDRLLYNYRRIAGLDTKGVDSYGGWISPDFNLAGQFEAHYVTALVKATHTMPHYVFQGETVQERLEYMMTELEKCYNAFATAHSSEAGYLGAIATESFDMVEQGSLNLPGGNVVRVPWYVHHKNMEAMYDVYMYAPTPALKTSALKMLTGMADWAYGRIHDLTDAQKNNVLKVEYGGMAEILWQTYSVTRKSEHMQTAKFFEEKGLIDNTFHNVDILTTLHANTTIPKFLGCAAHYEVTGEEYYKTVCVNAFDRILTRTYANGSTSCMEHWEESGKTTAHRESSETCCSYNMLKLADYLYRWTGDKKYMDYFENVYTNHILASMAPDTGLKTYLTNTDFGYYKIYHTADNSFWCCTCTGLESFAKLPYGIFYTDKASGTERPVVRVNMFYPATFKVNDTITLQQSGNFFTEQKTTFTVSGSGTFALALRIPDWAKSETISIKVNNEAQTLQAQSGYYVIDRAWQNGDTVEYSVPFSFRLDPLKGTQNVKAIMYGPLLFVADLGNYDVHDVQESQEACRTETPYVGNIGNKIVFEENWMSETRVTADADGQISFILHTLNQGDITFRPFNQLFHSRYGMYFEIYDTVAGAEYDYTVSGNEWKSSFDGQNSLTHFTSYTSGSLGSVIENGKLITPFTGESKTMAGVSLSGAYVVEVTIAPYRTGGAINAGLYLYASGAANETDKIKAYNIQIERNESAATYTLALHWFSQHYGAKLSSVVLPMPVNEEIALHVFVGADGQVRVYIGESRNAVLSFEKDVKFITETACDVGVRSYESKVSVDNFRIISAQLEVGKNILNDLLAIGDGFTEDEYTVATWGAFATAKQNALAVKNNTSATQEQVNAAERVLRSAIEALVIKERDELAALVLNCNNLVEGTYTETSWSALQAVLQKVSSGTDTLSDTEIKALFTELQTAYNGLVTKEDAEATAALEAEIAKADAIDLDEYQDEGKEAFTAALSAAKTAKESGTTEQKKAATTALTEAMNALQKKETPPEPDEDAEATAALEAEIAKADAIDLDEYQDEGKEAFTTALSAAKTAKESGTTEQKKAATAALTEAMNALQKKVTPPKKVTPKKKGCGSLLNSDYTMLGIVILLLASSIILLNKRKELK